MYKKLAEKCYYLFSEQMEFIHLAAGLFSENNQNTNYKAVYGEEFLSKLEDKYRFLGEILKALPIYDLSIFEFLINYQWDTFDLSEFENYLLKMSDEDFFYTFFGESIERTLIQEALRDTEGFDLLYQKEFASTRNYLAIANLFQNKKRFVSEFISCAKAFATEEFYTWIIGKDKELDDFFMDMKQELSNLKPLEFSEKLMGKSFHNRGPYHNFIFVPSYFVPYRVIRFFGENQILFYSMQNKKLDNQEIIKILKVVADETRFHLIELLSENGTMIGKDLAAELGVATSTISHHMEQLKSIGLLNEEKVKNSKYYSINSGTMQELMQQLSKKFLPVTKDI